MAMRALQSRTLARPCAEVVKLLADATRLRILELLLERPLNVQTLNKTLGVEPTLLSHHLRALREAAMIEGERHGRFVVYRVTSTVRSRARAGELDFGCCRLTFDRKGPLRPPGQRAR